MKHPIQKSEYKIVVVSDSHGENRIINQILACEPDADALIHCGDVCGSLEEILDYDIPVYAVGGNCDSPGRYPRELEVKFGYYNVFIVHGDQYRVDYRDDLIFYAGKERFADVVCFGHSHVPQNMTVEGMLLLNPGSVVRPKQLPRVGTYAVLTISEDELPRAELRIAE